MRRERIKLAIFGAPAAFKRPLYTGAPIVERQSEQRYFAWMKQAFRRNCFTNNGPLLQRLEKEVAGIHSVKHCVAVCNATIAQMLLLKSLGLRGEVILPSFTFIATAHACLWQGLKPVFCDIEPDTLTIDAEKAERLINKKTSAIIGVHLFGNVCNIGQLERLAKNYKLKLIFDAAHAFKCSLGDKSIGGFGNAEMVSFHATKLFSTFEGGAVLTNDRELACRVSVLRNFGFTGYDKVEFLGINAKMPEASAAMGLASLPAIGRRISHLKKNYFIYRKSLVSIPGISLVSLGLKGRSNYQFMPILVEEDKFGVSRDILYDILWKENVIARRYFYPGCHRMHPYKSLYPDAGRGLSVTEDICGKILCLPMNLKSPQRDIAAIRGIIVEVRENAGRILEWKRNRG
jgi:dTDP-4-amino-4,6-dideoxygalactose transaminase